jgi:hypothetical protein
MAEQHPHSRDYLSQQIANTRDITASSRKLLDDSKPNTFAGRKTREPFPDEDPMERADIQNLINSELQPPE